MKKAFLTLILVFYIYGCSPSDPKILGESISDTNPVTGQMIMLQVYASTDNYPLYYNWSTSGVNPDDQTETQDWSSEYWVYWITPDIAGTYTIVCTTSDDADNEASHTFTVDVEERVIEDTLIDQSDEILSMEKQTDVVIGGVWISIKDKNIRYITSSTNDDTTWAYDFNTFYIDVDPVLLSYTLWGADNYSNVITVVQSSNSTGTVTCQTCYDYEVINDFATDVLYDTILWVAADSGLHLYDKTGNTWYKYTYMKVYDLYQGTYNVYAGTTLGIYALDANQNPKNTETPLVPLYDGDTCSVLANDATDTRIIWSVTNGQVCENGQALSSQPDEVACSLDMDHKGNIWNGKYWWDGSAWQSPPGLDGIVVVKSIVSREGLVYMLTDSGTLLRW